MRSATDASATGGGVLAVPAALVGLRPGQNLIAGSRKVHVTELTGPLREGADGDQLRAWPQTMRVFARRERPRAGAQLTCSKAKTGGGTLLGRAALVVYEIS
jgi:hypothetical protein